MRNIKSPSICPDCRQPKRLALADDGLRKLKCVDCEGDDPLRSAKIAKLLAGELGIQD
jgi:hypothetical protein